MVNSLCEYRTIAASELMTRLSGLVPGTVRCQLDRTGSCNSARSVPPGMFMGLLCLRVCARYSVRCGCERDESCQDCDWPVAILILAIGTLSYLMRRANTPPFFIARCDSLNICGSLCVCFLLGLSCSYFWWGFSAQSRDATEPDPDQRHLRVLGVALRASPCTLMLKLCRVVVFVLE